MFFFLGNFYGIPEIAQKYFGVILTWLVPMYSLQIFAELPANPLQMLTETYAADIVGLAKKTFFLVFFLVFLIFKKCFPFLFDFYKQEFSTRFI